MKKKIQKNIDVNEVDKDSNLQIIDEADEKKVTEAAVKKFVENFSSIISDNLLYLI